MVRNDIYAALLNQLLALTTNKYSQYQNVLQIVSRGFVMWDQATSQPAVYIVPVNEEGVYKRGLPTKWLLRSELYVYVKWVDSVNQGAEALADTMDAIEYVLSPVGPNGIKSDNGYVNNLGGIVSYCALSGSADMSLGFLGNNQTVARMPVEILSA